MEVIGKKVTHEQAEEIILRTSTLSYFSTNSGEVSSKLMEIFFGELLNKRTIGHHARTLYDILPSDKAERRINSTYIRINSIATQLEFLLNQRIVSAYIGGPHGWCDWDGTVGCDSYNIGKWPSIEEVYNEWKLIAATFPYLELNCRLFSGETCEENIVPVVEFTVNDGKVVVTEPKNTDSKAPTKLDTDFTAERLTNPTAELGIDLDKLENIFRKVVKRFTETRILDI